MFSCKLNISVGLSYKLKPVAGQVVVGEDTDNGGVKIPKNTEDLVILVIAVIQIDSIYTSACMPTGRHIYSFAHLTILAIFSGSTFYHIMMLLSYSLINKTQPDQ